MGDVVMDKKKILIVDDETDLVETVVFQLQEAGYEVTSAYDGLEGLEKAQSQKPDLIILDLMLPKMDGYKVCKMLKVDNRHNKIPIILFSARAGKQDEKLGYECGANAYITKPFEASILLSKIKELLKE